MEILGLDHAFNAWVIYLLIQHIMNIKPEALHSDNKKSLQNTKAETKMEK